MPNTPAPDPPKPGAQAPASGDKASAKDNGVPWQRLFFAAVVLVAIYLVFALAAFLRADDSISDALWNRSAFVLQGVEAIAFTAVGWLFGREVHRGEAQAAKEQAADAKDEAKQATERADTAKDEKSAATERAVEAEVKGRTLADAVRAKETPSPDDEGGNERGPAGGLGGGESDLGGLKALADSLFPPR